MSRGQLYGIGVGPGDPELLTIKAMKTIAGCPVVAAPRTSKGNMLALDIVRGAMDLHDKVILPLDFTMSPDREVRSAAHRVAAGLLMAELDAGRSVAMVDLGDVSIYASLRYVSDLLVPAGYSVTMVPGITSFCAAAAALGISLTDMHSPIHIIPNGIETTPETLQTPGTYIWMKPWPNLAALLDRLKRYGLSDNTMLVQNCGLADQRLFTGLDRIDPAESYFTLIIVRVPGELP